MVVLEEVEELVVQELGVSLGGHLPVEEVAASVVREENHYRIDVNLRYSRQLWYQSTT